MALDPALAALLSAQGVLTAPDLAGLPLAQALAALRAPKPLVVPPPAEAAIVEDGRIPGPEGDMIPIRIYRPPGAGRFPLLLNFHGGGWVGGGISNDDARCHLTAVYARTIIVSVDYRLAPEHKFPAGLEDAYAALLWAAANGETLGTAPHRIALGGASAGGNLAAACAMLSHQRGGPRPLCLILNNPICDTSRSQPSHQENAKAPLLTSAMVDWFIQQYLPAAADPADPLIALLRAPDLSWSPPTLIITAGCDPLRDEATDYAASLHAAGVPVILRNYDGMVHGFLNRAPALPQSQAALAEIVAFLKQYL